MKKITGITGTQYEDMMSVEFTYELEFSPLAEFFDRNGYKQSDNIREGRASFSKYDDGWRIQGISFSD